ncbi:MULTISPECIES: sialate O-acetylesterase [Asticcacaulis]|uniref:sialate O-acetylesterase n=1 Tax=Asticcacaulis TaxID=76890 RepID=UPI001AE1BEF7|nr:MULTISPECIES: sialate O-acetylesterase [Asticcacaulis]MBP2161197.1 sialate O-acetylesterase [Asticcacaulis solisilvae]MDR6802242.1 sialate O-acetylesterase [Asticcacaulis sp. BE141]
MKNRIATGLIAGLLSLAGAAGAQAQEAFGLAPVFADHAVLQRDKPVAVWGRAAPNSEVSLSLSGGGQILASASGRADASGVFSLTLPQQKAGGPYVLTLTDSGGHTQTLQDILVGDVWLCSGQSNMEFALKDATNGGGEVAGASNPALRIFDVPRNSQPQPTTGFAKATQWQVSAPASAANTSAVCYFMARQLADTYHVPQGMIHASWGGTAAQLWVSREGLASVSEMSENLKVVDLYRTDPKTALANWKTYTDNWWRTRDPDFAQAGQWSSPKFADKQWPSLVAAGAWENSGIAALKAFDGIVWYRQTITLTAEQAARAVAIDLGPIDDSDTTWVNGKWVGATDGWNQPRHYTLPKGVLKAGANVIAIRVLDTGGGGGLHGAPADRALTLDAGERIALSSEWRYHIGADIRTVGAAPTAPWAEAGGPSVLYNGMIAPLVPYTLKGVAWYQGESNAGDPALYAKLLPALVKDWRARFHAPDLPFLPVQLSTFGTPQDVPYESGWGGVRDVQRRLEQDDKRVGMAVSYDVGDRFDIHPTQKRQVGLRLALAARKVAYGEALKLGPRPERAYRRGNDLVVDFSDVNGALKAYGGKDLLGFEVCEASCHFASAHVEGGSVVLPGAGSEDAKSVRFGWSDAPILNLYDAADLPASTFALDIK